MPAEPELRFRRPAALPYDLASVTLCGLLLFVAGGCSESSKGGAAAPPEPAAALQARVFQVSELDWPQVAATQGNLVADETAVVGAKVAGRIGEVAADLGDAVEAGAVLAALDRAELEEQFRQAEAELAQARAAIGLDPDEDLAALDPNSSPVVMEQKALWEQTRADRDRIDSLRTRQAATDLQYETAATAERVAKARHLSAFNSVREKIALVRVRTAQLELARQALEDAEVRAPFAGRVQERHVSPGMFVPVGAPVVTLVRDDPLRYRGTVPEPYAQDIKVGQRVRLRVLEGPELPEVTISRISPSLDPFSRSLLFEALVPNPGNAIHAGQFTQGEVVLDRSRPAIALPKSAVVRFAGTQKVWKVVDGRAVDHPVETGATRDGLVEILDGVAAGDRVLVDGAEGRPAEVRVSEVVAAGPAAEGVASGEAAKPR